MSTQYVLHAEARAEQGKGASRRLRREGKLPAIVYGGGKEPKAITLKHNEISRHLQDEAFYSQILKLDIDGATEPVVLRDLQRHPSRPLILHVDLQRILADEAIRVSVPLHFINEDTCVGVKAHGGSISHVLNEVEVQCLPGDLPEYIEVDLEKVDVGESIHLSDIDLPEGLTLIELALGEEHDQVVVAVHAKSGGGDEDSGSEAETGASEPDEE
ncbi:MAG TPA: 50S ribosomal protein L25/general stress protein Ctc [Gammaproteobacteria bacterium]|nr:50S ribosomal protein L25/general stress protein Ctc [Gammaproteobacteria bacterium]